MDIAPTNCEEALSALLVIHEICRLHRIQIMFVEHDDLVFKNFLEGISNEPLPIVGSELILAEICRTSGFPNDGLRITQNRE